MPHTSHRNKAQRNKRAEVVDENGWTRVTTSDYSRRVARPFPVAADIKSRYLETNELSPSDCQVADMPEGRTLDDVKEQYRKIEKRWLLSESYRELNRCLEQEVSRDVLRQLDTCLVFGTGSFCGYVQGWIARHDVAMFQLAAFISIIDTIARVTGIRPRAHAQEPRYNQFDTNLLSHLNVGTYITPEGFKAVTTTSFTYLPGAELDVTLRTIAHNPAVVLISGGFDGFWRNEKGEACTDRVARHVSEGTTGCRPPYKFTEKEKEHHSISQDITDETEAGVVICTRFREDKDVRKLPALDAKDEPFHDERLYFRRRSEDDVAG